MLYGFVFVRCGEVWWRCCAVMHCCGVVLLSVVLVGWCLESYGLCAVR